MQVIIDIRCVVEAATNEPEEIQIAVEQHLELHKKIPNSFGVLRFGAGSATLVDFETLMDAEDPAEQEKR